MMYRQTEFVTQINTILQGIASSDLSDEDRKRALEYAIVEHNRTSPRRRSMDIVGDDGQYYLLYGRWVDTDKDDRSAYITLKSSGIDQRLGVKFSLTDSVEISSVEWLLSRVGISVEGSLISSIYSSSSNLPSKLIAKSIPLDIDDFISQGIYRYTKFTLNYPIILNSGTYHLVLDTLGYTYGNGSSEIRFGVDQSDVANNVSTYDGSLWAAYGTDSAGLIRVVGNRDGWVTGQSWLYDVEYPAASVLNDEQPQILEPDDWMVYRYSNSEWLYFPNHSPSSSETIRVGYYAPYRWVNAEDPEIDLLPSEFEALCTLAAAISCEWLAIRYGQRRDSSINADVIRNAGEGQARAYRLLADRLRENYRRMIGFDITRPGATVQDVDYAFEPSTDFLFHSRGRR